MTNLPSPLQIGMLIYPGVTLLDFVGPLTALGTTEKVHLVSKTLAPVLSDSAVSIVPTATFETCPADLDVLFVPGGLGTAEVMEDAETLRFLADRGSRAKYVTSVCSGSLILAIAGLLDGYRATTHWSSYEVLAALGVEVSDERVVVDRNRLTGGGVTAGIDFGLVLLAQLRGEPLAKMSQLAMEYDPAPPFDAGRPEKAGPEATAMARSIVAEVHARTLTIAGRRASAQAPRARG
ncbi:DJ-1/PfpI family protein [Hyalangium versicolor]|uniref:DJ-1/PfpI family protein n=1 Tax=Hyalangium versicolor TaxID=2861190 RepID=UPI001CCA71E5|nr:DJ-1/PfpI family protein [Hyalangium versicolor]